MSEKVTVPCEFCGGTGVLFRNAASGITLECFACNGVGLVLEEIEEEPETRTTT
jgi:hypothetical protein